MTEIRDLNGCTYRQLITSNNSGYRPASAQIYHQLRIKSRKTNELQASFDEILSGMSEEEQNHWNTHLHFVPTRSLDLDNWLATALNGKKALAIDTFQEIREIGYLGNPATFTGTYLSYIAHEAVYLNYELETFMPTDENYDEVTIFDEEIYTGGWASTTTKIVDLPDDLSIQEYNKCKLIFNISEGIPNLLPPNNI